MSILFKISQVAFGVIAVVMVIVVIAPVPASQALEFTTEAQLVERLSSELSFTPPTDGAQILGAEISIPFFPRGYTYPIPTLGNCGSQAECFDYCEEISHAEVCAMVSFRNGKMTAQQLKETLTLTDYIKAGYLQNCNDINSCVKLCDQENAQDECKLLASNLRSGSRVLGAQDDSAKFSLQDSVLQRCTSVESCSMGVFPGQNANTIMESLIASGNAPGGCNSTSECLSHCAASQSEQCKQLYYSIASVSGGLDGINRGRVLSVSENSLVDNPGELPTDPQPTPPPTYEPTNYLNCVVNSRSTILDTSTDTQQFDQFNGAVDQCGTEFSPTESAVDDFAATGQEKAGEKISEITNCILGMRDTRNISSCLE